MDRSERNCPKKGAVLLCSRSRSDAGGKLVRRLPENKAIQKLMESPRHRRSTQLKGNTTKSALQTLEIWTGRRNKKMKALSFSRSLVSTFVYPVGKVRAKKHVQEL